MPNPLTSECVVDKLESIEFPFRIPYFLKLKFMVIGSIELSVSEQDHGHMGIEEVMKWCSYRIA